MGISDLDPDAHGRRPWNAGNMVGAKRPLKPRDVWAIRFFLDEHRRLRDRALFDLAIDSKLRGCDIVKMKIGDIAAGGAIRNRATVKCAIAGGLDCSNIVVASSTSDFNQWRFGALAYDVTTGASSASWAHNRKSEAKADAFKSCGKAGCWVYTFQTGYGGIAMSDDGFLYGAWAARDEKSAGKIAVKNCEKEKGKKSCSVVATGAAVFPPTFKPKPAKAKK
jgi:Domain of unknown function (DUF4189)